MKALFLTNEFPPNVYGGAGVHVDFLSKELARLMPVEVRCFGDQRLHQGDLTATGFGIDTEPWGCPKPLRPVFGAVRRCTDFNTAGIDADIVHCHTWYTHLGGIMARVNYGVPLVITVHSLEPLRPWKREQLGGGYDFSVWLEKTALEMADAIISVSHGTREDILRLFDVAPEKVHVIHNGIDLDEYRATSETDELEKYGVDPSAPFVLFVGRITRQKGIIHLVNALRHLDPGIRAVLCAGAPDTPEIAEEMRAAVALAQRAHEGITWIREMVSRRAVIQLYSHASVFCCPSIYEPFGIINLEAMACGTPVVASAVGGIPEVVVDGQTGFLVPVKQMTETPFEPVDPEAFARGLAGGINTLMRDVGLRERMGRAGRERVEAHFGWDAIARETRDLYARLLAVRAAASQCPAPR